MNQQALRKDFGIILIVFIISRIVFMLLGIRMNGIALYQYWQYLDVETLRSNLLAGIWYDHAQPPFFNLFLGIVVKIFGHAAPFAFESIFKIISLVNSFLILVILRSIISARNISLLISLVYLLSPATLIFESELFYTTFISMLLLISVYFILRIDQRRGWTESLGIFLPLALLALTRSMYHLAWLIVIALIILIYYWRKDGIRKLFASALISVALVSFWYFKNLLLFGAFSASSWIGMNMARNVFHDNAVRDSSRIEAYEPFAKISVYKPFITDSLRKKFAGLNDRDLLAEMKNDSFINENNIEYIDVSKQYMEASKTFVKQHPVSYLKNVLQSSIIFFTSATRYPLAEEPSKKIKYYDVVYSFNLSHFAEGKPQRRVALTLSAIPKLVLYLFVFGYLIRRSLRLRQVSLVNLVIIATIGFVFVVSSLLEHYENMRFRYEIEPLFLLLLGQVLFYVLSNRNNSATERNKNS